MNAETVLQALRSNTEGLTATNPDGSVFRQVYLDNAIPEGMPRHQFAGFLSALEGQGLYISQEDGAFGMVKVNH